MSVDARSSGDDRQHSDIETKVSRLRHNNSTSQTQQIKQDKKIPQQVQSDKPFHVQRDSLLTWSSGFENFDGWFVYGILLFTMGGTRLLLENAIKYGVQVSPTKLLQFVISQGEYELFYRTPMYVLLSNFNFLFVYFLEHKLAKGKISSSHGTLIQIMHLILVPLIPALIILNFPDMFSLLGRYYICSITWISVFKIWSYVQVNKWCRRSLDIQKINKFGRSNSFLKSSDESDEEEMPVAPSIVQYPNNLTLSDLYYFYFAPTLCYELNFPRSQKIRIRFLLKRLFEAIMMINIQLAMVQQWVVPTVMGSYKAFTEMDYIWCTERILKLAVPFHVIWLIFFYLYFHSFLNILAEILRFGDRKFYEDWWNARDLPTFWRQWNLPFHNWAVRHMYIPMLKSKYSRTSARTVIFTLSALFHEYFISIPLIMYKVLVFIGFFLMVPLMYISEKVADIYGVRFGNAMMWLFQVLGLPIIVLVYYHYYHDYLLNRVIVNAI